MQQKNRFAFVAGISIGLWGGTLGAFLICTEAQASMYRLLNNLHEGYLDLSPPISSGRQLADVRSSSPVPISSHG
jgi:hypothetical protein